MPRQFADLVSDCNVDAEKVTAEVTRSNRFAMTIDRRSTLAAVSKCNPGIRGLPTRQGDNGEGAQRQTRTGMLVWVSTLLVVLPSKIAEIPPRPCEAMTITSQPLSTAVAMIAL